MSESLSCYETHHQEQFKEEGLLGLGWLQSTNGQEVIAWEPEAGACTSSIVSKQRAMDICSAHFHFTQSRKDLNPVNGAIHNGQISTSVNLIMVIPHRHAQSHFSQKTLANIKLTTELHVRYPVSTGHNFPLNPPTGPVSYHSSSTQNSEGHRS